MKINIANTAPGFFYDDFNLGHALLEGRTLS